MNYDHRIKIGNKNFDVTFDYVPLTPGNLTYPPDPEEIDNIQVFHTDGTPADNSYIQVVQDCFITDLLDAGEEQFKENLLEIAVMTAETLLETKRRYGF